MASWQARAAAFLLRRFFKPRLVRASEMSAGAARRAMTMARPPLMRGTRAEAALVGGVKSEWVAASAQPHNRVLLYLHGGGYFACSPQTHRSVTSAFAVQGWRVLAPDYRLAPEHPFPAGLDDALAVYRKLIQQNDAQRVALAGDSAGGGLCVALLLRIRDAQLPMPAAAALFSPFVDLAASGDSSRRNSERCAMFTHEMFAKPARWYVGDGDVRAPLASPLYADLTGLPPLLIHVGEDETLLDDSVRLAQKAVDAGVSATLKVWPRVPHVWQLFHRLIPEGRQSLLESGEFLAAHVAR